LCQSYDKKCHTTYTTDYEPQQEEECEDNYKKDCFIEYKKVAQNVTVEFCHTPLVKVRQFSIFILTRNYAGQIHGDQMCLCKGLKKFSPTLLCQKTNITVNITKLYRGKIFAQ
jgi:hypothetical protein